VFDAPREAVFAAWTEPARLALWWGPEGFTNPVCEFEARVGGRIYIDMTGPDGTSYPMTGTVDEVEPPARLVFTASAFDGQLVGRTTVEFIELGDKTRVVVEDIVTHATDAVADGLAGMEQGWSESLVRLAALVGRGA
jgi:uncharacterized protein YndB with AHSA1/START domain